MLADRCSPALLACAAYTAVLTDRCSPALLASVALTAMIAMPFPLLRPHPPLFEPAVLQHDLLVPVDYLDRPTSAIPRDRLSLPLSGTPPPLSREPRHRTGELALIRDFALLRGAGPPRPGASNSSSSPATGSSWAWATPRFCLHLLCDPEAICRVVLLLPHPSFGEAGGVRDGGGGGRAFLLLVLALALAAAPGFLCT